MKTIRLVILIISLLGYVETKPQGIIHNAENDNFLPIDDKLISSSIRHDYRFYDPFEWAHINSKHQKFAFNKNKNELVFTINRLGSTNSHEQLFYVLLDGAKIENFHIQEGYKGQKRRITDIDYISLPISSLGENIKDFIDIPGSTSQHLFKAFELGRKHWDKPIMVYVELKQDNFDEAMLSIVAKNPSNIQNIKEDLTRFVFSPVLKLTKLLGESTSNTIAFSRYKISYNSLKGDNIAIKPKKEMDLVYVNGGCFSMGSNSGKDNYLDWNKPEHKVCLDDFYISKNEITHEQFIDFLNKTNTNMTGIVNGKEYIDMDSKYCAIGYDNQFYFKGNKQIENKKCPVIEVSWYGAKAFAEWKGGRLPTEAEWEFCAKGGNKSVSTDYAGSEKLSTVGWYGGNSGNKIHPVGQKKANELGIFDMSGNVWEWCIDSFDPNFYKKSKTNNPVCHLKSQKKVIRGGSYLNPPDNCRVTYRKWSSLKKQTGSDYNTGFRVVIPD